MALCLSVKIETMIFFFEFKRPFLKNPMCNRCEGSCNKCVWKECQRIGLRKMWTIRNVWARIERKTLFELFFFSICVVRDKILYIFHYSLKFSCEFNCAATFSYYLTKRIDFIYKSSFKRLAANWTFSPGLNAGSPKYGHEAHRNASPK